MMPHRRAEVSEDGLTIAGEKAVANHCVAQGTTDLNRPGMSGDLTSWEGWSHVRWFVEEVPAGAA